MAEMPRIGRSRNIAVPALVAPDVAAGGPILTIQTTSEPEEPTATFSTLARRSDREIDVVEGALLIATEESGEADPEACHALLDAWTEELTVHLDGVDGEYARLQAICRFLYDEKGLHGNTEDYYDPRNSYIDQVLERRTGIPITLALLLIEMGRRVGVPLQGVGFPGHFLVRHGRHPQILLDPFDGGRLLTREDCAEILHRVSRGRISFSWRLLQPVGPREILLRINNNLRGVYLSRGEIERALAAVERILLLYPEEPCYRRDRGLLRLKLGRCCAGIRDLEAYLEAEPEAHDWDDLAELLERAREATGECH